MILNSYIVYRYTSGKSNYQRCSIRKGVLRNSTTFTGKHLCQSLFFNNVAGLRPREHLWATSSEVAQIAFTYLLLTLTYFYFECKILVKSATGKRRRYWGGNYKLINVSNLVKIKPKHANSKSFYHGKLKIRLSICNLCWHFLTCFFLSF